MGLGGTGKAKCLASRFPTRKNLPRGCVLSRQCFFRLHGPKAKRLCPAHSIWPAICAIVNPWKLLVSGYSATNANARIKDVFGNLNIPYARSYSSHGFRMGATQDLKEKGPQWSVCATVDEWGSIAFFGYVDADRDVDRDMSKLRIETEGPPDSDVLPVGNGVQEGEGQSSGVSTPLSHSYLCRSFIRFIRPTRKISDSKQDTPREDERGADAPIGHPDFAIG